MCTWVVLVYIPKTIYPHTSLIRQNCIKKILVQHFFIPALLCFNTSYKNSLVLTLVLILLGCFLNPIHMMTTENHWMVVIFFLEICKTEISLLVFIDVTSKTLSCYMFLIFSFCVYYKVVSI